MTVDFKREQQQNIFKALKKSMTETNTFCKYPSIKNKGEKKALKNFCKVKFEIRDNSLLRQKKKTSKDNSRKSET